MARLKIKETGRNWWNRNARRYIFINGKHTGTLDSSEMEIEVEPGPCKVTIRNAFPGFQGSSYLNVEDGAENNVVFRDRKWFWNFLMAANVVLMFIRGFIRLSNPVSEIFRTVTHGYAFLWIIGSIFSRDDYYRMFAWSKVPLTPLS